MTSPFGSPLTTKSIPLPPEPADLEVPETILVTKKPLVPPVRKSRITWASEIGPKRPSWLWDSRIPVGSLSLAAGREATGKSSFGLWCTAALGKGALPGTFAGRPRRVLYVAVEDSWEYTLVPRLMAAGADLGMVGRFDVIAETDDELTLSLPVDNELLEAAIRDHDIALVVIDPLMSVMGAGIDTHKEREVRSALDPLAKIADRTGCVILGIAHFNKSSGTDAAALITGSGAFKNVPRTVFGFARDDTDADNRVMTQVKNSLGRDDLPSLTYVIESADVMIDGHPSSIGRFGFTGESDRTVMEVLRDSRNQDNDEDAGNRSDVEKFIQEYLQSAGGSAPSREVINAGIKAGLKEAAMTKARFKARNPVIRTERRGFGKDCVFTWSIDSTDSPTDSTDSSLRKPETMETVQETVSASPPSKTGCDCPICGEHTPHPLTEIHGQMVCRRCKDAYALGITCGNCGKPRKPADGASGLCFPCLTESRSHGGAA